MIQVIFVWPVVLYGPDDGTVCVASPRAESLKIQMFSGCCCKGSMVWSRTENPIDEVAGQRHNDPE